ncbi:hypothetical protein AGR7A_pAt30054 [Agrobacterium deltaense NCPPB 1641]|uniref:Uncharacterized protein n=1 Tax=Agrobacterium deltaense NCPPB 1641 TaxID=1183425 RepID=A0A1S7UAY3_9HYPH|nr:hypothetical protein AGR7A_pAt30054 [Agrobacterium deltaense NCPPB 1641]
MPLCKESVPPLRSVSKRCLAISPVRCSAHRPATDFRGVDSGVPDIDAFESERVPIDNTIYPHSPGVDVESCRLVILRFRHIEEYGGDAMILVCVVSA